MRHFDVGKTESVGNLFELGKDLFDGAGNPAIQGTDAERILKATMRG